MNREKSNKLFARALEIIPGGVNSPVRACKNVGKDPVFINHAQGCMIFDEDGISLKNWESLLSGGDSDVYNLGNNRGYSVREVIELARKVTGKPIPAIEANKRPGDPAILIASSDKIKERLGWKPEYEDLETIIKTAWKWHQKEAKI